MDLPVWNAHEPDLTAAMPGADRGADAIRARGWQTPPGVGQRWGAVSASGSHAPELGGDRRQSGAATTVAGWHTPEPGRRRRDTTPTAG